MKQIRGTQLKTHPVLARRWIGFLPLAAAMTGVALRLVAHDLPAERLVELTVLTWANARSGGDTNRMAQVISGRFQDRTNYLSLVPGRELPFEQNSLRHAKTTFDAALQEASVSPVVVVSDWFKGTLAVLLEREGERWVIVGMEQGPELPSEFRDPGVGRKLHPVRVTVHDADTGKPVMARVHVSDASGIHWPPEGHARVIPTALRENTGGDVVIGGKTFAYVEPEFTLPLPEGNYRMEVARGLEYEPATVEFVVGSNSVPLPKVALRRWSHLNKQG